MKQYSFNDTETFYGHLNPDCDAKKEMTGLLTKSRRELKHRIDELSLLRKQFQPSGKTITKIDNRIHKMRWAIQKGKNEKRNNKKSPDTGNAEGKSL
jgi:hypothetical protein